MDIAALKAIPISDLLQRLGHAPVKQRGRELSYFAPYRQEHEPSLRVNVEKNLFYDFGIAQGGDIFKLAGLLCHSDDFKTQANFIAESMNVQLPMKEHPVSFSQRKEPSFEDVEIHELSNRCLMWYLRDRGISAEVAKANCDEIHYWLKGKEYYAIGFKNIAGGFELRNKFAKLCIPPKDVSLIAGDTSVCNVYEGFMDYLSAAQMGEQKTESAMVLNSVSNVHRAFRHLDSFAEIRCYLDNDDAGRQALKTLSEKYPDKVIDRSSLYQGHNDVNDWLMAISPKKSNKLNSDYMTYFLNKLGEIRLTPLLFFGFFLRKATKARCGYWAILFALVFSLCSCDNDLDVQQSYPFTVDAMPYGDKIANGETIELRFEIKPEGNYTNTLYTIRYFQYEGEGELKLVGGPVLVNNDRVLLESKSFRLNYTAKSSDSHKFLVVVEDSMGSTPWQQTFEFNNDDSDDDGNEKNISSTRNPEISIGQ